MKPTCDRSKYASYLKSTSQSNRSSILTEERGEHASHGGANKSSERAGAKSHEHGGHGSRNERAMHSLIGIQKALRGTSCPVKKQVLVKTTQANGAVDSTLKMLRNMPDDEYDTPTIISKVASNERRYAYKQEDDS